jgi:hypothetical protein
MCVCVCALVCLFVCVCVRVCVHQVCPDVVDLQHPLRQETVSPPCERLVLQWCYSGVSVVQQWCCSGVTVVLQWYASCVAASAPRGSG